MVYTPSTQRCFSAAVDVILIPLKMFHWRNCLQIQAGLVHSSVLHSFFTEMLEWYRLSIWSTFRQLSMLQTHHSEMLQWKDSVCIQSAFMWQPMLQSSFAEMSWWRVLVEELSVHPINIHRDVLLEEEFVPLLARSCVVVALVLHSIYTEMGVSPALVLLSVLQSLDTK